MFAIVVIMWENEAMRYFRLVARLGKERGQHGLVLGRGRARPPADPPPSTTTAFK